MATTTSSLDFPCPSTSSFQVIVDDSDSAQIQYSDGWFKAGTKGFECNATTHGTAHVAGTHTTATFSFEGIGVQVYGSIASGGIPTSTYQVDDLPLFTFTFNTNTGSATNYRVQYYASPLLEPGNHTLVISSEGVGSSQMFLDYIIYNPIPSFFTNDSSSANTSIPPPSTTSLSSSESSTSHSNISAGALAGGVIGGTVLGLILGILFAFVTFRRRKQANATEGDGFDSQKDFLTETTSVRTPVTVSTQSHNAFPQTQTHMKPVGGDYSIFHIPDPTSQPAGSSTPISPPTRRRTFIPDRKQQPGLSTSSSEPMMVVVNGGSQSGSGSEIEEEVRSQTGSEDGPPAYAGL